MEPCSQSEGQTPESPGPPQRLARSLLMCHIHAPPTIVPTLKGAGTESWAWAV